MLLLPLDSPFVRLRELWLRLSAMSRPIGGRRWKGNPSSLAIQSVGFWTIFARFLSPAVRAWLSLVRIVVRFRGTWALFHATTGAGRRMFFRFVRAFVK